MAKIVPYMERLILEGGLWWPGERPGAPLAQDMSALDQVKPSLFERFVAWQNGPIEAEDITAPIRNLPAGLDGYRVALVSDTHLAKRLFRGAETVRAVERGKPDLICLLGDLVDSKTAAAEPYLPFLRGLTYIAPTIAIMGNNDYVCSYMPAMRDMYMQAGVPLLEDETRIIPRNGANVRVIGLQDYNAFAYHIPIVRDMSMPNVAPLSSSDDPDARDKPGAPGAHCTIDILLLHRPQRAAKLSGKGFALALAGHAHGGQWRLPWGQGLFAPGQGFLPKYTSGLYKTGAMTMIVSRGVGNHEFPIRLGNRPHVPIVTLKRQ